MGSGILEIIQDKGLSCHQINRFNLDNVNFEPYEDEGGEFSSNVIFETSNRHKTFVDIKVNTRFTLFKYFLDGSRYTYKIADMETTDGRFMPIVAGQLAAGVCRRDKGKMSKFILNSQNVLMLYNLIEKDDFIDIKRKIEEKSWENKFKFIVDKYEFRKEGISRPENFAIAKIQEKMHVMEIDILTEMVNRLILKSDEMLIIDGSLQFMDKKADERLFKHVIGVSKSFNPNLSGVLKNQTKQIATILSKLEFGQRTPVYKYPLNNSKLVIGAWYLRIRPKINVKNILDGIIKVEKVAVGEQERDSGFESRYIDNISQAILQERNVTCHGKDERWCSHLYPMYLTERMLKESFLSGNYFLNLF